MFYTGNEYTIKVARAKAFQTHPEPFVMITSTLIWYNMGRDVLQLNVARQPLLEPSIGPGCCRQPRVTLTFASHFMHQRDYNK